MKTIREMAAEYAAAEYEEVANRACGEADFLAGAKAALEMAASKARHQRELGSSPSWNDACNSCAEEITNLTPDS